MRHKPKYNELKLVYMDNDGVETAFQANDVTASKYVSTLLGMPIKDSGSRFITDSDIEFVIDNVIVFGEDTKRITELPEVKIKGNNQRRGYYRRDKIIVTT